MLKLIEYVKIDRIKYILKCARLGVKIWLY